MIELLNVTDIGATPMSIVVGLGATLSATVVLAFTGTRLRARWLRWLALLWAVWAAQYAVALMALQMPVPAERTVGILLLAVRETMLACALRELGMKRAPWYWAAGLLPLFLAVALGVDDQWILAYSFVLRTTWWGSLTVLLIVRDTTLGGARRFAAVGTGLYALILLLAVWMHNDARYVSAAAGMMAAVHFSIALGVVVGARETLLREEEEAIRRVALALEYVARGFVPMCAHCHSVRDGAGAWRPLSVFAAESTAAPVADVLCPTCLAAG